jgi:hypothetical protein
MIKVFIDDLQFMKTEKKDNDSAKLAVKESLLKLTRPERSFEVFKKDFKERLDLKTAKKAWKKLMKSTVEDWTAKSDYYTKKVTL